MGREARPEEPGPAGDGALTSLSRPRRRNSAVDGRCAVRGARREREIGDSSNR